MLGDFNGDGHLDAVVGGGSIATILQTTLRVSTGKVTFGDHTLGSTSGPHPVDLVNIGSTPIRLGTIAISADSSEFALQTTCKSTLQPGHTCVIRITFSPAAEGLRSATVDIPNNSEHFRQTVSVSGTGTIAALSPQSLNFGNVAAGRTSNPQSVTMTNAGTVTLHIYPIETSGPGDFTETNTCGTSLAPKASCKIKVTFSPLSTGGRTGSLVVSDDGGGSPQRMHLAGTGT